jgi:uncharacterized protein YutE (UPF0331/DUF86 family)
LTQVERDIVYRKLSRITEDLRLLQQIAGMSFGDYVEQPFYKKAAERMLQEVIEAAVDINAYLLVSAGFPAPADYYWSFVDIAEKLAVLEREFAVQIAPSAGLRNRIVHEYDKLDDSIVFTSIRQMLKLYPRYVEAVADYIARLEKEP